MAKLTEQMRLFIVRALASYHTPTEVAGLVKEEFDVEITRQQVHAYNPEAPGQAPAKKWCKEFTEARKAFRESTEDEPIAIKAYRVRELTRNYRKARNTGNLVLANETLAQAAKEMGGSYTNRQELTGKGGKDLPAAPASNVHVYLPAKKPVEGDPT